MSALILEKPFEPWQFLQSHQDKHTHLAGRFGATAVFVGTMRDMNQGDNIVSMVLEHYAEMTQKYLDDLIIEAKKRWDILDALIVHRVGQLLPNEPIVLVAVWSAHRADAYAANRHIMEKLKSNAPFWKKEQLENRQNRWVEKNTPG